MELDTLKKLFIEELKDVYSAEKQLVKALPKMANAATNADLKQGFLDHLDETKGQVERIEKIFKLFDMEAKAKTCKAMQGLIEEGEDLIKEKSEASVLDAGLIGAAQKVEHYEIASYGTLRTFAETLGETEAVQLLQATLDEEKATDQKLSELATSVINIEAAGSDSDDIDELEDEVSRGVGRNSNKSSSRQPSASARTR